MDARLLKILNNREQNYPHALEKQFPRVFGQIMALWDKPEIDALFSELMVTKRSDRQGFPSEVASDIIYLSMVHTPAIEAAMGPRTLGGMFRRRSNER